MHLRSVLALALLRVTDSSTAILSRAILLLKLVTASRWTFTWKLRVCAFVIRPNLVYSHVV